MKYDEYLMEDWMTLWSNEFDKFSIEMVDSLAEPLQEVDGIWTYLYGEEDIPQEVYDIIETVTGGSIIKKYSETIKKIEEWYEQKYKRIVTILYSKSEDSAASWFNEREKNWLKEAIQDELNGFSKVLKDLKKPAMDYAQKCIDGDEDDDSKYKSYRKKIIKSYEELYQNIITVVQNKWISEKFFETIEDKRIREILTMEDDEAVNENKNDEEDISVRLEKLKELFESGVLDEAEYKAKKKELLNLL